MEFRESCFSRRSTARRYSSLAPATAVVRVGAIAVRAVTTGRLRSARLRTVGTCSSTLAASIRRTTTIGSMALRCARFSNFFHQTALTISFLGFVPPAALKAAKGTNL